MAKIKRRDQSTLERYLKMDGGYVLDFSNRTFAEFFEGFDIDIYAPEYQYGSGSKANLLRGFWGIASFEMIGEVLLGLIEHNDEQCDTAYEGYNNHSEELRTKCIKIADVMINGTYDTVENSSKPISQNVTQAIPNSLGQYHDLNQQVREPLQSIQKTSTNLFEKTMPIKQKVFIVHGHDEILRLKVENFISKVGLEPIVLMDKASGGNTIIEKIEEYGCVDFAIVLYTSCDEGRKIGTQRLRSRARQNVVFEHGYFIARLSRKKVAAIVSEDVEIQNDIKGVVYIDAESDWQQQLLKEFAKAELRFDANKLYVM